MPEPLNDADLERLMLDTHALVDSLRAGETPLSVDLEGQSETADKRLRVTIRGEYVESITLDPRLLRLPPETFGQLVREAVNVALDDLLGKSPGVMPDLAALSQTLREVRDEGLLRMGVVSQGIDAAMARIRERTYIGGDPSPHGLEHLLDLAQRNLDDMLAATASSTEDIRGEGSAANGRIRAVVAEGHVESVLIEREAMSMASHDLAEELRTAMNAALDDLRSRNRDMAAPGVVNSEELTRRVREVQDMSIDQMRGHARALRDIVASIQGPE